MNQLFVQATLALLEVTPRLVATALTQLPAVPTAASSDTNLVTETRYLFYATAILATVGALGIIASVAIAKWDRSEESKARAKERNEDRLEHEKERTAERAEREDERKSDRADRKTEREARETERKEDRELREREREEDRAARDEERRRREAELENAAKAREDERRQDRHERDEERKRQAGEAIMAKMVRETEQNSLYNTASAYIDEIQNLVAATKAYSEQSRALAIEWQATRQQSDLPVLQCKLQMPKPREQDGPLQEPKWIEEQWLDVENVGAGPALDVMAKLQTRNLVTAKIAFSGLILALDVISGHPEPFRIPGTHGRSRYEEEAIVDVELTYRSIHGQPMMTKTSFQSFIPPYDNDWVWNPLPGEHKVMQLVHLAPSAATIHSNLSPPVDKPSA
jgi:hypothetical protein